MMLALGFFFAYICNLYVPVYLLLLNGSGSGFGSIGSIIDILSILC